MPSNTEHSQPYFPVYILHTKPTAITPPIMVILQPNVYQWQFAILYDFSHILKKLKAKLSANTYMFITRILHMPHIADASVTGVKTALQLEIYNLMKLF